MKKYGFKARFLAECEDWLYADNLDHAYDRARENATYACSWTSEYVDDLDVWEIEEGE